MPQENVEEKPSDDIQVRARKLGWRPKDEYIGDDDKFVDAEDFLKQAEEELPRLRRVNQHLERKVDKMEKGVETILSHQERQIKKEREDAYSQAKSDLQKTYLSAVEDGDTAKAEKAWEAREALAKRQQDEIKQTPVANQDSRPPAEDQSIASDWIAKNPWYNEDPIMADFATKYETSLAKRGIGLKERLKMTTDYIKKRFPQDFEEDDSGDGRPKAPMQSNGSGNNTRKVKKVEPYSYEALKKDAKAECDRTVATSGGKITKETWLIYATEDMFE